MLAFEVRALVHVPLSSSQTPFHESAEVCSIGVPSAKYPLCRSSGTRRNYKINLMGLNTPLSGVRLRTQLPSLVPRWFRGHCSDIEGDPQGKNASKENPVEAPPIR